MARFMGGHGASPHSTAFSPSPISLLLPTLKPLRILQVTNRIPWPLNDGGNIAMYNLTRCLRSAGHHVELACLNTSKHRQDPAVLAHLAEVHAVDIDTSVTAWGAFAALFSNLPYNVSRFLSEEFSLLLGRLLAGDRFDLVQLEGSFLSLYIPAIRHATRAPIVLRSHNIEHQIWSRLAAAEAFIPKKLYLGHLARGIRRFELEHLHMVDAIVPIALQDEEDYRRQGFQGKMRTIHGGVDLAAFAPRQPIAADRKLGFLGSLEWQPNLQGISWFVAEVWPLLRERHSDLELHVAGKNPPDSMRDWDVPGMHFHGMVAEAAAFMESCHFFILPLLSGGGMRIKLVEAMANGRCCISTRVGAEGIDLEDGGDIVLADTPEEWLAAIGDLLAHPAKSQEIARRGQARAVASHGLEAIGVQLVDFYREVLA